MDVPHPQQGRELAAAAAAGPAPTAVPTLNELEKRHLERSARLKSESEAQFKKACQSGVAAATSLAVDTNAKVHDLHQNSKRVEHELKELNQQTETMQRRVQDWASLLVKFNAALKELGDVNNWATMIDRDIDDTVKVLDAVALAKRRAAGLAPAPVDTDAKAA
jgi:predicted  nucleic acid-binding Zn-ribbon protein